MFNIHVHGDSVSTREFKYKSKITGETTVFYPERGLITIEGAHWRTGEPYYERVARREFLIRAAALSLELKHMKYTDERRELQRCVEVMARVGKAAGDQGDPFNAQHMQDMVNAGSARTVVGFGARTGGPQPAFETHVPPIPRAPADKPVKDLGGTQVLNPSRIIVTGR